MRLRLSLFLVSAFVSLGCFDEPPPSSSDGGTTTNATSTGDDTSTTTEPEPEPGSTGNGSTTGVATTEPATTTGSPESELLLYPLTCTAASWRAGRMPLPCETPEIGPYVDTHDNYTFGGRSFARVIEARPPNVPFAPVDGVYEIDTSEFASPMFRSQVACGPGNNCAVGFEITSESGDGIFSSWQGAVATDEGIVEVVLELPSETNLIIHLNISVSEILGDSRFLWIDPRVVEAAS
ncbi:MAG: hypothetical protein KUG77_03450 [Nannocystaceae bacterium]|nr:hypothetical protein [Nannocystaceae bacterium]